MSKPENTNQLLSQFDLKLYDYIVTTDDDITIPDNFIDDMVAIMQMSDFDIAGPAQRLRSYHNHDITRRRVDALARFTNFVEVGPLVVFRGNTFDQVFPLPVNRYGWGVDLLWSKYAKENNWKLGIIDATAIKHLSPAGSTYDWAAAHRELEEFRTENSISLNVDQFDVLGLSFPLSE